jgi:hypothetical protein
MDSKGQQLATQQSNVGRELYDRGWRQGRILRAASLPIPILSWQTANTQSGDTRRGKKSSLDQWSIQSKPVGPDDYLLVASQDCDIAKPAEKEPHIEVLQASWSTEIARIAMARGKSYQLRRIAARAEDSKSEALIADAAWRALLDKRSLIALQPEFYTPAYGAIDTATLQDWLGARFSRLALPDELVEAIQQPLVAAIRKLNKNDVLHEIMAGIDFVLCVLKRQDPLQVELWFVVDEDGDAPSIPWIDAAKLATWIDSVLKKKGVAELVNWDRYTTDMLSFRQFNSQYLLDLDEFSRET